MEMNFTIGNILLRAWQLFAKNWMVFLGLFIAYMIIDWILSSFFNIPIDFNFLIENPDQTAVIMGEILSNGAFYTGQLISLVLGGIFTLVFTKALLDAYDQRELIFHFNFKQFFYLILTNILYSIIVGIGLVFFIFPGIYLALRLQFYSFSIIDKDNNPIESLKDSWNLTKDKTLTLFLLIFVYLGIVILGILLFIIGIFPAIIICMAAQGVAYRLLMSEYNYL